MGPLVNDLRYVPHHKHTLLNRVGGGPKDFYFSSLVVGMANALLTKVKVLERNRPHLVQFFGLLSLEVGFCCCFLLVLVLLPANKQASQVK